MVLPSVGGSARRRLSGADGPSPSPSGLREGPFLSPGAALSPPDLSGPLPDLFGGVPPIPWGMSLKGP